MSFDFQAKIGPLPAWAWGGLIGVGVVGFSWYRSSSSAAVAAGSPPVTVDGVDGAFGNASGGSSGVLPTTPDSTDLPDSTEDPSDYSGTLPDYTGVDFSDRTSLETWIARAVLWLSGQGVSPAAAQDAISDYLDGTGDSGGSIAQQAVLHFGAPPLGLDPSGVDLTGTPAWEARTPENTPMPPPLPGLSRRWDYVGKVWFYHKPTAAETKAADGARSVGGTPPKPPDKAGYDTVYDSGKRLWYYAKKGAASDKNPGNTPMPPARPGWDRRWNYAAQRWTYYNPATKATVMA